jgi:hypothetical protein
MLGSEPIAHANHAATGPAGYSAASAVALIQVTNDPTAAVKENTRTQRLAWRMIQTQRNGSLPSFYEHILNCAQQGQIRRHRCGRDGRTQ